MFTFVKPLKFYEEAFQNTLYLGFCKNALSLLFNVCVSGGKNDQMIAFLCSAEKMVQNHAIFVPISEEL